MVLRRFKTPRPKAKAPLAETCVGMVEKRSDNGSVKRGAVAYRNAKAEVRALIAWLNTPLDEAIARPVSGNCEPGKRRSTTSLGLMTAS
jgi:hypothetical protein